MGNNIAQAQRGDSHILMTDPFNLQRFVEAQEWTYETALAEIQRGAKHEHWMWFIFPQIAGLGRSEIALRYAIGSLDEARAYLDHAILGCRLRKCVETVQGLGTNDATEVFGHVDSMKFRSSLTLFARAGGGPIFDTAITRWFGSPDPDTLRLISAD